jgi:hypothetical protein
MGVYFKLLLSHNIDRNTDKLLDIYRFRSMDAFWTCCTDPKNKTRGKYVLVCSTAASLRQTVLFLGSVHHVLARFRDQMKNGGQLCKLIKINKVQTGVIFALYFQASYA